MDYRIITEMDLDKYRSPVVFISSFCTGNFSFSSDLVAQTGLKEYNLVSFSVSAENRVMLLMGLFPDAKKFKLTRVNKKSQQLQFKSQLLRKLLVAQLNIKPSNTTFKLVPIVFAVNNKRQGSIEFVVEINKTSKRVAL